jgi:hypothetical protein
MEEKTMKKLALVIMLSMLCIPSFAQYKDAQERLVDRQVEYHQFDTLLKYTTAELTDVAGIAPSEATSTGTVSVYYLPDTFKYPILLRIQNIDADDLRYVPYVTGAAGVTLPTATAAVLVNKDGLITDSIEYPWEKIFYTAPALTFNSASGPSSVVFEVWGRSGDQ